MKKSRRKRKIIEWQVEDQGANPLTVRGRKWIDKEISKIKSNTSKLRKELESQSFDNTDSSNSYWLWVENYGDKETTQANPDLIGDDLDNTVD